MTHVTPLFACMLVSLLSITGCKNALDTGAGDAATVFVAEGDDLFDSFDVDDDGFQLSHVIAAQPGFSRVGLRFDAVGPVAIEARVSSDGGATFGGWSAATTTFAEAGANNAYVDAMVASASTDEATHLQLRFIAPVESQLTFLAVDAFAKELDVDEAVVVVEGAEIEQGLSGGLVQPRSAWNARVRNCNAGHTPAKITIHHTETPTQDSLSAPARVRQIQNYHIDVRGWCDIGYHFLIAKDGTIYQGRSETTVGTHVANDNTGNVGVSFIGSFDAAAPPAVQMQSASTLLDALGRGYGIRLDRTTVKGHRERGDTSCPGNALFGRINSILEGASSAPTAPTTPPADDGPQSCARVEVVGASTLNVRPEPGTGRAPIGTVSEGDVVDVVSVVDGQTVSGTRTWYQVRRASLQGYISGAYARCHGAAAPDDEPAPPANADDVYDGITRGAATIPRAGLANDTLRGALGIATEPYGSLYAYEGNDYVRGRTSWFGGPRDTGVTSTETGALSGERLRSLNSPVDASAATVASRPQDFYFIAMRWDYTPHGRSFWQSARVVVVNPDNGKRVVLRAVDWGPNTNTGRVLDISPQALKDLGADTDDNLLVAFAADGTPLGVVP